MIYTIDFRDRIYRMRVTGHPNPRWTYESFHLEDEVRKAWWNVREGDSFIDCGAGFGSYTLPALALGAHGVAVEPGKEEFFALCQNLHLNRFMGCIPVNCVLCDVSGIVMGYDQITHSANLHSHTPMEHRVGETVDTLCTVYDYRSLEWLKIDVEGGEVHVIAGAENTLKKFRPKVIVEIHLGMKASLEDDVNSKLQPLGYRLSDRKTGKGVNDVWALYEYKG